MLGQRGSIRPRNPIRAFEDMRYAGCMCDPTGVLLLCVGMLATCSIHRSAFVFRRFHILAVVQGGSHLSLLSQGVYDEVRTKSCGHRPVKPCLSRTASLTAKPYSARTTAVSPLRSGLVRPASAQATIKVALGVGERQSRGQPP